MAINFTDLGFDVDIWMRGKNVTAVLSDYLTKVDYTDNVDGEADSIEIELENVDKRWQNDWYPNKGDALRCAFGQRSLPLLMVGGFEIDQPRFSGPPSVVTIRALSAGVRKPVRTKEGKAFENKSLAQIVAHIAKKNKLKVVGKIPAVHIDRVTQIMERDVAFLQRLASQYGFAFKITGDKLVFTDRVEMRKQSAVMTFTEADFSHWDIVDQIKDVQKSMSLRTYDVNGKKVHRSHTDNVPADDEAGDHTSEDELRLTGRAGSASMTKRRGVAALAAANDDKVSGNVDLAVGDQRVVAGLVIQLADFGKLSGQYIINRSKHSMSRSAGYTTNCEIKRVGTKHA
jgi:phage protein D